jgi:hypothetical protein
MLHKQSWVINFAYDGACFSITGAASAVLNMTYRLASFGKIVPTIDSSQLDKIRKCSESQKLIKTGRVQLNGMARVITPVDLTRLNPGFFQDIQLRGVTE